MLAQNAKLRALAVPQGPEVEKQLTEAAPAEAAPGNEREAEPGNKQPGDLSVPGAAPGRPGVLAGAACTAEPVQGRSHRLAWARLHRRVLATT